MPHPLVPNPLYEEYRYYLEQQNKAAMEEKMGLYWHSSGTPQIHLGNSWNVGWSGSGYKTWKVETKEESMSSDASKLKVLVIDNTGLELVVTFSRDWSPSVEIKDNEKKKLYQLTGLRVQQVVDQVVDWMNLKLFGEEVEPISDHDGTEVEVIGRFKD